MNWEVMLLGLLVVSALTGLTTEAVKKVLKEHGKKYHANTLAGIVSLVISIGCGLGYMGLTCSGWSTQIVVYLVALVFLSWLCAMVGYDKVIQTISQFHTFD